MIQKDFSMNLDGTNLLDEYGLIMTSKYIGPPTPQTKYISIPGRNGALDLSTILTGEVTYNQREIKCTFYTDEEPEDWSAFRSELQSAFHGKDMQIIFDDDSNYYWQGRVEVDFDNDGRIGTVSINALVYPYKRWVTDSWLWDPFDFENGVIYGDYEETISGSGTITITLADNDVMTAYPVITVDAAMTVTFDGTTESLEVGTTTIYSFVLAPGDNVFTFTGSGDVSIAYVGGSL